MNRIARVAVCAGAGIAAVAPAAITTAAPKVSRIAVSVQVAGRGRVVSVPGGIRCPSLCRASFAPRTRVRLVARAAAGWRFVRWAGPCSGGRSCSTLVTRPVAVRARFARVVPHPPPPSPTPPPLTGTGGLHTLSGVAIDGAPAGAAAGFDSVWVRTAVQLYRIDAGATRVLAAIQGFPGGPSGFAAEVAAGEGAVWTSNIAAGTVSRVDPATNAIVATIPVWPVNNCGPLAPPTSCSEPAGIVTTPGAVWVALHHESQVARIDPIANRVAATIAIPSSSPELGAQTLIAAGGAVYAGGNGGFGGDPGVERIDAATNAVTRAADVPGGCDWKAANGTHLWLAVEQCRPGGGGAVVDVDLATRTVVGRVELDAPVVGVAVGAGAVWCATPDKLVRIDPATHAVTGTLSVTATPFRVVAAADGVWLTARGAVYRIAT